MGKLHRIRKAFHAGTFNQALDNVEVRRQPDGERRVNVGWWCGSGYKKFIAKLRQERRA